MLDSFRSPSWPVPLSVLALIILEIVCLPSGHQVGLVCYNFGPHVRLVLVTKLGWFVIILVPMFDSFWSPSVSRFHSASLTDTSRCVGCVLVHVLLTYF